MRGGAGGKTGVVTDREREYRERVANLEGGGRAANEEIVRQWGQLTEDDRALFRCECGVESCDEALWLPLGVYERVRGDSMAFVIRPGHDLPDVESVVERGEGYAIVRKHDDVRHITEATDPRR